MQTGDEHRLFQAGERAIIRRAEHIWYENEIRIVALMRGNIFIQIGTVYRLPDVYLLLIRVNRDIVHELVVHGVKPGRVSAADLEAPHRQPCLLGQPRLVVVGAPIGGEALDAGSKYLQLHLSFRQLMRQIAELHLRSARYILAIPRYHKSDFLHVLPPPASSRIIHILCGLLPIFLHFHISMLLYLYASVFICFYASALLYV